MACMIIAFTLFALTMSAPMTPMRDMALVGNPNDGMPVFPIYHLHNKKKVPHIERIVEQDKEALRNVVRDLAQTPNYARCTGCYQNAMDCNDYYCSPVCSGNAEGCGEMCNLACGDRYVACEENSC